MAHKKWKGISKNRRKQTQKRLRDKSPPTEMQSIWIVISSNNPEMAKTLSDEITNLNYGHMDHAIGSFQKAAQCNSFDRFRVILCF